MVAPTAAPLPMVGSVLLSAIRSVGSSIYWLVVILVCISLAFWAWVAITACIAYYYTAIYIAIRWTAGHRMLFQTTGPTLFDIGVICAGILTLTSLIPGPAVMGQSSTRDTTFSQGLSIFLKSLLASTLVVVAFNSVILVLIFVIVATRCAVPAVRGRRARQDAEQDDDIEVASFIDRRDAGGDDGAETVDDKDNDPNDKENRDVFPITFAGFLAYFVDEARQPTKAFADTGEEIKTATPAAPSLEGRTA